jgi:hypothetical protein
VKIAKDNNTNHRRQQNCAKVCLTSQEAAFAACRIIRDNVLQLHYALDLLKVVGMFGFKLRPRQTRPAW